VRKRSLGACLGVLVLALAGLSGIALAKAGKGKHQQFDLTYTTKSKAKGTGVAKLLTQYYNFVPQPVGQEADPVTGLKFTLPKGSKLDFKGIPAKRLSPCTKAKLGSSGDPVAAKCPEVTKGTGVANAVVTGLPNPISVTQDVKVYAGPKILILRLRQRPGQLGQTANIYISARGRTLNAEVPKFCAADNSNTPFCDTEVVLTRVQVGIKKVGSRTHPLITTPKSCPKGGWKSTATYKYRRQSGEKVTATSPCRR
jgi:hypothetical protein